MTGQCGSQDQLFYSFNLDEQVPSDHLLRGVDRFLDLGDLRKHLASFYSHTGRRSIDPVLMIRMLVIGDCFGIRSTHGEVVGTEREPRGGVDRVKRQRGRDCGLGTRSTCRSTEPACELMPTALRPQRVFQRNKPEAAIRSSTHRANPAPSVHDQPARHGEPAVAQRRQHHHLRRVGRDAGQCEDRRAVGEHHGVALGGPA